MVKTLPFAVSAFLAIVFLPAPLLPCVLEISIDCPNNNCSTRTTNVGTTNCTGDLYSGFFGPPLGDIKLYATGDLTECFSTADYPPEYFVQPFAFCYEPGTLRPGDSFNMQALISGTQERVPLEAFSMVLEGLTGELVSLAWTGIEDLEEPDPCSVSLSGPSSVFTNDRYRLYDNWAFNTGQPPSPEYREIRVWELFPNGSTTTQTTSTGYAEFLHDVSAPTTYSYRAERTNPACSGIFSSTVSTTVYPTPPPDSPSFDLTIPFGSTELFQQQVAVPNPGAPVTHIQIDFLPADVATVIGPPVVPAGTPFVTFQINPVALPVGTSEALLRFTFHDSAPQKSGQSVVGATTVPVSVSLVTQVTSTGKTAPPPNSLIIPAVAHVSGGAFFQSDVRLTNPSSSAIEYELFFTPSLANGLTTGKKTSLTVAPGQTVAMNDVVKNFFGYAGPTDSIGGSMEIRPVRTSASLTRATSRTYSTTALGTLGQFIPAISVGDFIGTPIALPGETPPEGPPPPISLQQVAQNSRFRTNLGLVEGSGAEASGRIRVLSASGQLLSEETFTLKPAEHRQLNGYLGSKGLTVDDARIEVQVESTTGRLTSYASVIDGDTQDPFLVAPARPDQIHATRYVLPGVAALDNPGSNFFSDVRIYNGGTSSATATVRYVALPGLSGGGTTRQISVPPGQVVAYDNILVSLFGLAGTGGALIIDTPSDSSLVVTGRTYSRAEKGTYGQFIPAITSQEGTALGEQPLQILQLEQSPEFRSNLGLVELTGRPVTVRISTSVPDSRVAPFHDVTLAANEMRQFNSFLASTLNLGTAFNTRVTVEVTGGEGRVAAYGSVVDFRTSDPTYVPAR